MNNIKAYAGICRMLYGTSPRQVLWMLGGCLPGAVLPPVQMYLTKLIVDNFQDWSEQQSVRKILLLTMLLAGVLVGGGYFFGTRKALSLNSLQEVGDVEKEKLILEKTSKLEMADVETSATMDMRSRALRFSIVQGFEAGISLLSNFVLLITLFFIISIQGHWIMAWITGIITSVSMLFYAKTAETLVRLKRKQTSSIRFTEYLADLFMKKKSLREIRISGMDGYLKSKWEVLCRQNRSLLVKQTAINETIRLLPDLSMILANGIFIFVIAFIVSRNKGTVGDFTLLFQAAAMIYGLLPGTMSTWGSFKTMAMQWEDFQAYLALPEERHPKEKGGKFSSLSIEVRNLKFRYPGNHHAVIDGVSFTIPMGKRVAFVGENGSGKSTLVKLLLGFYKPEEGEVKWISDGKEISLEEFRRSTAVVFQDYGRFYVTVRENVALGNLERLREDKNLEEALQKAEAYDKFKTLSRVIAQNDGAVADIYFIQNHAHRLAPPVGLLVQG